MGTGGVTFSPSAARRIAEDVQWGEGMRRGGRGTQKRFPKPTQETASPIVPVVVRTRAFTGAEAESQIIEVTPIVEIDDEVQFDEDHKREMWTWFNLRAKHYAALAQVVGGYSRATNVLPAMKVGKKWRVFQAVRWNFALQEEHFKVEGCLPVVVP